MCHKKHKFQDNAFEIFKHIDTSNVGRVPPPPPSRQWCLFYVCIPLVCTASRKFTTPRKGNGLIEAHYFFSSSHSFVACHTAKNQYRKFETNIPRKGIVSCGHSPNFHIHVPVSDLYIPTIDLLILLQENMGTDPRNV
jgi:hypothetical protein